MTDRCIDSNVVAALTEEHVAKATGISVGQLRAWDRRGFFRPMYGYDKRNSAYSRIYSFKDVVGLKTIATLRDDYKVGFKKLREVASELERRGYSHWADTRLFVVKKDVHFQNRSTGDLESLSDGQYAMLPIVDVIEDVRKRVVELKVRAADTFGKVEHNKYVARNSWVVSGTRIPTSTIRRYADAGFSIEKILEEYPSLTEEDVRAALEHEGFYKKSA